VPLRSPRGAPPLAGPPPQESNRASVQRRRRAPRGTPRRRRATAQSERACEPVASLRLVGVGFSTHRRRTPQPCVHSSALGGHTRAACCPPSLCVRLLRFSRRGIAGIAHGAARFAKQGQPAAGAWLCDRRRLAVLLPRRRRETFFAAQHRRSAARAVSPAALQNGLQAAAADRGGMDRPPGPRGAAAAEGSAGGGQG